MKNALLGFSLSRRILGIMFCTVIIIAGGVQQAWASAGCDAVNSSAITKNYTNSFYANVGPYHSSIGPTTPNPTVTTISDFAVGDTISIHIQGQGHGTGTWRLRNGNGGLVGSFNYSNNPGFYSADRTYTVTGINNDTTLTQTVTASSAGITTSLGGTIFANLPPTCTAAANLAPTAVGGADQSIRAGDTVNLDGSASFDDNTPSAALVYSWSFTSIPMGSTATLTGADTATPSFISDLNGDYVLELEVTDEGGLSDTDEVTVGSNNLAPTAAAGNDQLVIVGNLVNLDGSSSSDPEMDYISYSWSLTSPIGSAATLSSADTAMPSFTPDVEGSYLLTLEVSDFIGPGLPDTVEITATSANGYAENRMAAACSIIESLSPGQVTTKGNQNALCNFIGQAVKALQKSPPDTAKAIDKLEKAIERTDGCVLRGSPDGNGNGRDWITHCAAQAEIYQLLNEALNALTP